MRILYIVLLLILSIACNNQKSEDTFYSPTGIHEVVISNDERITFYNLELNLSDTGNYHLAKDSIIVNQKYMGHRFGDSLILNGVLYTPNEPESQSVLTKDDFLNRIFLIQNPNYPNPDTLFFQPEKLSYSSTGEVDSNSDNWFLFEKGKRQYLVLQNGQFKRFMLIKSKTDSGILVKYYQQNQRNTIEIILRPWNSK